MSELNKAMKIYDKCQKELVDYKTTIDKHIEEQKSFNIYYKRIQMINVLIFLFIFYKIKIKWK